MYSWFLTTHFLVFYGKIGDGFYFYPPLGDGTTGVDTRQRQGEKKKLWGKNMILQYGSINFLNLNSTILFYSILFVFDQRNGDLKRGTTTD